MNFDDLGMSRDEVCKWYANTQGDKYGFTDKDFAWVDEYEFAQKKSDKELLEWVEGEIN